MLFLYFYFYIYQLTMKLLFLKPIFLFFSMEAKLLITSSFTPLPLPKHRYKPVLAVLTTSPPEKPSEISTINTSTTVYKDNWFDKIAINHLSTNIQAVTGIRNSKTGFESLVEAASATSKNFNLIQQRKLIVQALARAFPEPIMAMIKTVLPQSKTAREFFAAFTTVFFVWLVGPCEVREYELNGEKEKNEVFIKKCRFLEESNCVGMCSNLCKMPSQTFIKDYLGMPVNMVPNFEDMSCQMIFGQEPPLPEDDPAFAQPCFQLCKVKQRHNTKCSS